MATGSIPPGPLYDPFAPAVVADPYPWFSWLREQSPCHHVKHRDVFVVTRYNDVRAIARDARRYSSSEGVGAAGAPSQHDLVTTDPPDHSRLRRMVSRYFAPKAMAEVEGWTADYVETLVAEALEQGEVDWVDAVARPLPTAVIAHMLGVPSADWKLFADWADAVVELIDGHASGPERTALEARRDACKQYLRDVIEDRRRSPREGRIDVISVLLEQQEDGALTDRELLSFCLLLLVAGLETTMNANSNGLLAMLAHPDEHRRLARDVALVPQALEEALRYDSPIQGVFRVATEDSEIARTPVPAGARLFISFASANRDDRQFADADTFDLDRRPKGHIAFGAGPHTCLGSPVTRMELRILGEALHRRVRRIALDGPVERTETLVVRGVRHLPVTLTPR